MNGEWKSHRRLSDEDYHSPANPPATTLYQGSESRQQLTVTKN